MDPYVDDELHLHLRYRLLEIRYPRFLLAPLPILRYPNTYPSTLLRHHCMVPVATTHGVFTMSAFNSVVGWDARREGRKVPYQGIDVFLLDSIDACINRLRDPYPARNRGWETSPTKRPEGRRHCTICVWCYDVSCFHFRPDRIVQVRFGL